MARDAGGRPTTVSIGSSGDSDSYSYDPYTGNVTNYTFSVNGKSDSGTLPWNTNGTLGKLVIADTFNSGGSQTCNFGYDDVARLNADNCGSVWNMPVTYDQYDNLNKSDWNFSYSQSNNQMQGGPTYDTDGHVTYDTINTYTWNMFGKMASVNSGNSAAVCGTSGTCVTV